MGSSPIYIYSGEPNLSYAYFFSKEESLYGVMVKDLGQYTTVNLIFAGCHIFSVLC